MALKTVGVASRGGRRLDDGWWMRRGSRDESRHPNVCQVHDSGLHITPMGEELPFLTMALVEGESLQQRLRREPLGFAQIETLACQLSSGLSAIHAARVMHLDIKSSSVMLDEGTA